MKQAKQNRLNISGEKSRLKTSATIVGISVIALVVTGCGSSDSDQVTQSPDQTTSADTEDNTNTDAPSDSARIAEIKESGVLRVATLGDNPPWETLASNGKPEGWDMDIIDALAEDLGVDITYEMVDGPGRVAALQSDKVDISAATFSVTPDRAKVISFTEPYIMVNGQFLVHSDSAYNTIDDLNVDSATICIGTGGTATENVARVAPNAKTIEVPGVGDCLQALESGQADAMSQDTLYNANLMSTKPGLYRVIDETFSEEPIALGVQLDDDEFKAYVDNFLMKTYGADNLKSSFETWFGFDYPEGAQPAWFQQ
jgi:polar amino acid transport system substrate-binding protein